MRSFWNDKDRDTVLRRLQKVDPAKQPRWGSKRPDEIMAHLGDQLRIAYGEIPCQEGDGPFRFWPVNVLIIRFLPWPKGAPSPKEAWTTSPETWEQDINALGQLIGQFGRKDQNGDWPHHPLFGKMNGTLWGILSYRHFDHHLRQLGV